MKIVVVIPTFNEAENIGKLIPILFHELHSMKQHESHILVVDGNSPDGTQYVVQEKALEFPNVHLLLETEKKGLGAAYTNAFQHAIKHLQADVLVEMDADFQHDPKDVPRLIAEIDNGYDYVIGSRFTKGGSIPREWGFHRKVLSWGGNLFSKIVLGIFNLNDFTSGFKASRVKGFVDRIDLAKVLSAGFAYKIDLLFKMHKLGAKFKEVPIVFGLRDRGDSKMERSNFFDSMKVVLLLRYRESQSFFKFIMVGFLGLFTDAGLFNILRILLSNAVASYISGFIAILVTFTFNNLWSFGDRKMQFSMKMLQSLAIYYIFSYMPIFFRSWLIGYSIHSFGDTWVVANLAFFVGIIVGLLWNFTVYSKIIWRKNA